MQMQWLQQIDERLKVTTPGRWEIKISDGHLMVWSVADDGPVARVATATDARFMIHTPTDIAKLIAAVRVAERALSITADYDAPYSTDEDSRRRWFASEYREQIMSGEFPL